MDCMDVQREIPSLIYKELDEEFSKRLWEHINACAACRREWEQYEETVSLLDLWPDVDAPLDTSFIRERAGREPEKAFSRILRLLWLPIAASLLIVVTLAFVQVEVRQLDGRHSLGRSGLF